MTRQEALLFLKDLVDVIDYQESENNDFPNARQALNMAIEALEQPEIVYCKDCKFNKGVNKCFHPDSVMIIPDDNDFCSYGKK